MVQVTLVAQADIPMAAKAAMQVLLVDIIAVLEHKPPQVLQHPVIVRTLLRTKAHYRAVTLLPMPMVAQVEEDGGEAAPAVTGALEL
jgi:hypothetical protein